MAFNFKSIINMVIGALPKEYTASITAYLTKLGTDMGEVLGWTQKAPELERSKELVKRFLLTLSPHVETALTYLEKEYDPSAGIFIQQVETTSGAKRAVVHIVTMNDKGQLQSHKEMFFHETGPFIIDIINTVKKEAAEAKELPPAPQQQLPAAPVAEQPAATAAETPDAIEQTDEQPTDYETDEAAAALADELVAAIEKSVMKTDISEEPTKQTEAPADTEADPAQEKQPTGNPADALKKQPDEQKPANQTSPDSIEQPKAQPKAKKDVEHGPGQTKD